MGEFLSVGQVARALKRRPSEISDALYHQRLGPDDLYPVISGRRMIPSARVQVIAGLLPRRPDAVEKSEVARA